MIVVRNMVGVENVKFEVEAKMDIIHLKYISQSHMVLKCVVSSEHLLDQHRICAL